MKLTAIITTLALAVTTMTASADDDITGMFTSAPQRIFPLLDTNTRLDMIDYFKANMTNESQNNLGGYSRITRLDPGMIEVKMSNASDVQFFLLDGKKGPMTGIVTTVSMPARDSRLAIYDSDWRQCDNLFKAPALRDWMTDPSRQAEVEMVVPFMVTEYKYNPAEKTLTLSNNLKTFLSDDIYEMVSPLMKSKIVYVWNGSKFVPAK